MGRVRERMASSSVLAPYFSAERRTGLVLGTGWAERSVLRRHFRQPGRSISFDDKRLPLKVKHIQGHAGLFRVGYWKVGGGLECPVVISQGRIHLNQCGHDSEVITNWLSCLLLLMGDGRRLLLTNAVGGLQPYMAVGSIAVPTSAVYHHIDLSKLLYPGEFVTTELGLPPEASPFNKAVCAAVREADLELYGNARATMIVGPGFGGKGDRHVMGQVWGCHTVGMSPIPELALMQVENAARRQRGRGTIHTGVVQLVTDNQDAPTHDDNQKQARKRAPKLGKLITGILAAEW